MEVGEILIASITEHVDSFGVEKVDDEWHAILGVMRTSTGKYKPAFGRDPVAPALTLDRVLHSQAVEGSRPLPYLEVEIDQSRR